MNRLVFEGRFLVNIAGSIVRQDAMRSFQAGLNWEQVYRTADYHKVANLVYLSLLGKTEHVPGRWKEKFLERYQESVRFGEVCSEAEKEILVLLDMKEIPCVILASCGVRGLYRIPEMAGNSPLILYLDNESYTLTKGYLVDLGYETDRIYAGCGERMRRASGFVVELYHDFPFVTKLYKKNVQHLMERAYPKNPYELIRTMSPTDRFIFRMAQAIYHYVTDELLIREVLDLHLYHKAWKDQINQEHIDKMLSDMHIDEIAEKLLYISYTWFGSKKDRAAFGPQEDMGVYDVLENRILSCGGIDKETDVQALELKRLIQQEWDREKRRERIHSIKDRIRKDWIRFRKTMRWIFPEYKYMCAIYSWLEKAPILLPVGWMIRGIRMMGGLLKH